MKQKLHDNKKYLDLKLILKFDDANRYNEPYDLKCMNMDEKYILMDGSKPKFVEFNEEPIPYEEAYQNALDELYDLFKDCKNYQKAREIILSNEKTLTKDKCYSVTEGCTGNYYGEMLFLYGDDRDETIYWDVRWY